MIFSQSEQPNSQKPGILALLVFFSFVLLLSAPGISQESNDTENTLQDDSVAADEIWEEPKVFAKATFAGGCFWCMEPPFDKMPGVEKTVSGYIGGSEKTANYEDVSSGKTQHREAIQITYDPEQVSYDQLLYVFWRNIDPIDKNGQFCDKGPQYTSAVYYHNDLQKSAVFKTLMQLKKGDDILLPGQVFTQLEEATEFYPAEEYHQDYYLKKNTRYKYYRWSCGRDKRLKKLWGDKAFGEDWKDAVPFYFFSHREKF